jgi:hypothetical protein
LSATIDGRSRHSAPPSKSMASSFRIAKRQGAAAVNADSNFPKAGLGQATYTRRTAIAIATCAMSAVRENLRPTLTELLGQPRIVDLLAAALDWTNSQEIDAGEAVARFSCGRFRQEFISHPSGRSKILSSRVRRDAPGVILVERVSNRQMRAGDTAHQTAALNIVFESQRK